MAGLHGAVGAQQHDSEHVEQLVPALVTHEWVELAQVLVPVGPRGGSLLGRRKEQKLIGWYSVRMLSREAVSSHHVSSPRKSQCRSVCSRPSTRRFNLRWLGTSHVDTIADLNRSQRRRGLGLWVLTIEGPS